MSDTERRREAGERAERLDSRRGAFSRWMERQGYPEEKRERELRQLDEIVREFRRKSER